MLSQKIKKINADGGVRLNVNAAIEALNSGASISDIVLDDQDEIDRFNTTMSNFFLDDRLVEKDIVHETRQDNWSYPDSYNDINLEEYFMLLCNTQEQKDRVTYELELYARKDMNQLLLWCIWFMDVCVEKNIFVGVGRGSSVASYCLFLIKIHLVDSIKYGIEPVEFFKEI